METTLSFGLWIKRRCKALDLPQDQLAALVGCSKDLIAKIEGDARRPSRQIAGLLAEHLALPPQEREDFIRCARAEFAVDRLPPVQLYERAVAAPPASTGLSTPALPTGTVTFLFTDVGRR